MSVCRYFQQGRCRFGEKCWYEHPGNFTSTVSRETHWVSPAYAAESQRIQQARLQTVFNKPSTSFSFRNASRINYSNNDAQQYESDSYLEPDPYHYESVRGHGTTQSDSSKYNSFSSDERGNKNDDEILTLKMDISSWKSKNIWPFSCYSHFKKKDACFPGFVDISPEELRYKAYEAKQKGDFQSYVKNVAALRQDIEERWNVLKESTPNYIDSIDPEYNFNLTYPPFVRDLICNIEKDNPFDNRQTESQFFSKQSSLSGGFKLGHLSTVQPSNNSISSSASTFRFVMPSDEEIETESSTFGSRSPFKHLSSNFVHSGPSLPPAFPSPFSLVTKNATKAFDKSEVKSSNYTPLEDLTQQENIQFSSQMFTLGKIPSRPPPMEMCF